MYNGIDYFSTMLAFEPPIIELRNLCAGWNVYSVSHAVSCRRLQNWCRRSAPALTGGIQATGLQEQGIRIRLFIV